MRDFIAVAKEVFDLESSAILGLKESVGLDFNAVIELILGIKGRLVVSGMGKSGHIGGRRF